MIKFKHLVFAFFFWILIFSHQDKNEMSNNSKEITHSDMTSLEPNYNVILKMKDQLNLLSLSEAATKFGSPKEKETIKIMENEIPYHLENLIKNHYPNKEYLSSDIEIIEASWKVREQSWAQVWYKLEYRAWIPIDIMITL